jgi:hypothetical protein
LNDSSSIASITVRPVSLTLLLPNGGGSAGNVCGRDARVRRGDRLQRSDRPFASIDLDRDVAWFQIGGPLPVGSDRREADGEKRGAAFGLRRLRRGRRLRRKSGEHPYGNSKHLP